MIALVRATRMEALKLRRTLGLWASILVPLLLIAMTTALNLSRNIGGRFDPGALPTVVPWDAFMHLFALPIPRWTIYVPKLLVGFVLVCLSSLVLALGIGRELLHQPEEPPHRTRRFDPDDDWAGSEA